MVWQGVIIEESLEDKGLLKTVKIMSTSKSFLENEELKGQMHFHCYEIDDRKKEEFVEKAKHAIKQGWYIHACKNGRMAIIFRNKSFEFYENEKKKIEAAKKYGISIGILPEQMDFENLIRNPFS